MDHRSSLPVYTVNAFTDACFGGNPAAVVPLKTQLTDELMQSIAAQHNLSETAFLEALGEDHYKLRWFSPTAEVPLCGHATLAAAYAMDYCRGWCGDELRFETASGDLFVTRQDGRLTIEFPAVLMDSIDLVPAIQAALGVPVLGMYQPQQSAWQMVCEVESQAVVEACSPDFSALIAATELGVAITARGDIADFVSRFFIPQLGIDEDPVTGSAHCQLTPFWAKRLGKTTLAAQQLSERGGQLRCEWQDSRVRLTGSCSLFAEGKLYLPSDH